MAQLSRGSLALIKNAVPCDSPILQIIDMKAMSNAASNQPTRYRLHLYDGVESMTGFLATSLNHLVTGNTVTENTIIRVTGSTSNVVSGQILMVILSLDIIGQGASAAMQGTAQATPAVALPPSYALSSFNQPPPSANIERMDAVAERSDIRTLVLLRHGESTWNEQNLFTGWVDCPLTAKGEAQARAAGDVIAENKMFFDVAFTSYLKRAIKTLWLAEEHSDQMHIPVEKAWELNERHYGALEGLNKAETARKYGDKQVHIWRRSYTTAPPPCDISSQYHPVNDRRYRDIPQARSVATESLQLTLERVLPYWNQKIAPCFRDNKTVLIAAHGNSLRALVKYLDDLSDDEVPNLNIPLGIPLLYELNANTLKPIQSEAQAKLGPVPIRGNYLTTLEDLERRVDIILRGSKA